jgi:malonyl-CoA O-methyltransferase
MALEHATVLTLLPDVRGLTVLDAGCGSGRYLRELGDRGARVIGLDLSTAMLEPGSRNDERIARADVRALPFGEMTIDLVVCGLALGDIAELELALAEIARVLRPGGASSIRWCIPPAKRRAGRGRSKATGGSGRSMALALPRSTPRGLRGGGTHD